MSFTTDTKFTGLFDQAVEAFSDSLKAGVKMQEDVANFWKESLGQQCPIEEFEKKSKALLGEVLPAAQKNAQEWASLLETNYRRSADLMKKALVTDPDAKIDPEAKTRELWETSVEAIKESAQDLKDTNVRVFKLWSEVGRKAANGHAAVVGGKVVPVAIATELVSPPIAPKAIDVQAVSPSKPPTIQRKPVGQAISRATKAVAAKGHAPSSKPRRGGRSR